MGFFLLQRCFGATLARVVDFDNHEGWVYDSCNRCFKRATLSGATYNCGSCRTSVSATPRSGFPLINFIHAILQEAYHFFICLSISFKLQLQVIDHTGSTSFTVFDSIVAKYIGKSAKAVIRGFSQVFFRIIFVYLPWAGYASFYVYGHIHVFQGHDSHVFPSEFQSFIGKQFLFKVEVSDGNVSNGWQSFTVKKMSSDDDLIQKFVGQHGINVCCILHFVPSCCSYCHGAPFSLTRLL